MLSGKFSMKSALSAISGLWVSQRKRKIRSRTNLTRRKIPEAANKGNRFNRKKSIPKNVKPAGTGRMGIAHLRYKPLNARRTDNSSSNITFRNRLAGREKTRFELRHKKAA